MVEDGNSRIMESSRRAYYVFLHLLLRMKSGPKAHFFFGLIRVGVVMDVQPKANSKQALELLQREVENIVTPLGYEVVELGQSTAGGRVLTLYIDFLNNR